MLASFLRKITFNYHKNLYFFNTLNYSKSKCGYFENILIKFWSKVMKLTKLHNLNEIYIKRKLKPKH